MSAAASPRTRSDLLRLLRARGTAFETLEDGPRWAIVVPSLAARILGAGVGEENAFWVSPAQPPASGWFNAGGQRTWIAPEGGPTGIFCGTDLAAWSVPPALDPGRYEADPAAGAGTARTWRTELEARAADGSRFRLGLARGARLEAHPGLPGAMRLRLSHELVNRGPATLDRRIGLWGLIQLPCEEGGGTVFLALARRGAGLAPYFGNIPPLLAGDDGRAAWLGMPGGSRFKGGISAGDFGGTLGFIRGSRLPGPGGRLLLTAMTFGVRPGETYVDRAPSAWDTPAGGDAAQVYQDPGTASLAFCEIEAHSPAPRLAPGEAAAEHLLVTICPTDAAGAPACLSEVLGFEVDGEALARIGP